jgi:ABC-type antimicrobial peptide transport system permease subunit
VFGIINTPFMSIYERMFEFGVLKAVGTRPAMVRRLVMPEAGALAVCSIVLGLILGSAVTCATSAIALDSTGIELAEATFTGRIHPELTLGQYTLHLLLVLGFTILMSLYTRPATPAGRASPRRCSEHSSRCSRRKSMYQRTSPPGRPRCST